MEHACLNTRHVWNPVNYFRNIFSFRLRFQKMLEVFFRYWIVVRVALPHRLLVGHFLLLWLEFDLLFFHQVFEKAIRNKVVFIDLKLNFGSKLCHLLWHTRLECWVWFHYNSIFLNSFFVWVNKEVEITLGIFHKGLFINFFSKIAKVFENEILMMVSSERPLLFLTGHNVLWAPKSICCVQKTKA